LRISIIVSAERREDALLLLETVGFRRDEDDPSPPPGSDRFEVTGELPERSIAELPAIDGVLDWKILPLEEEDARTATWPWTQKPETD
jgi:hypothetical protein